MCVWFQQWAIWHWQHAISRPALPVWRSAGWPRLQSTDCITSYRCLPITTATATDSYRCLNFATCFQSFCSQDQQCNLEPLTAVPLFVWQSLMVVVLVSVADQASPLSSSDAAWYWADQQQKHHRTNIIRDLRIVFLRSNRISNRIGRPIRFRIEFSNRIGRIYHASRNTV